MSGLSILGIVLVGVGVVAAAFSDWFGLLTGAPSLRSTSMKPSSVGFAGAWCLEWVWPSSP